MVSRRRFPGIWSNIWLRSALDLRKSQGAAPFISIPLRSFFGPQNPIKSEEKLIWYFKQIMFKYIYKSVYTNHSTSIFPWKHGTVQVFSSAQRTSTGKTSPLCGHSRPGTPRAETVWDWWLGSSKYRKKKMGENSRSHGATTEEKDGARCQHPIFDPWRVWDVFTKLFKQEQLLKPFDVKTINPTIHRAKFMSRS